MEVRGLRRYFGSNTLHGDAVDDGDYPPSSSKGKLLPMLKKHLNFILPIIHAFYDQLKEPLIIMLLFSAAISLFLGNAADAMSIALALGIVSLVAAVQEYRSERGEFLLVISWLINKCHFVCCYCILHLYY